MATQSTSSGLDAGHAQARRDGVAPAARRGCSARRASFLLSTAATSSPSFKSAQAASFEHAADSENDHFAFVPFCAFSILAQVSRSVTVRLKTGVPGVESGSTQK